MKTTYCFYFFVICFFVLGCKNQNRADTKTTDTKSKSQIGRTCLSKYEREGLIESILNSKEFQSFLHPEVSDRLPIILVKNDYVTSDLEVQINEQRVQFIDSLTGIKDSEVRLRITEVDCSKYKFLFTLKYPVEGAAMAGDVELISSSWSITNLRWGEF